MRKLIQWCSSLCAMVLLISASPVRAQNVLWVASNGSNANVCSQTSPCATFQGAINKGSVSVINCLNSGNYGTVTITASITIDCGTGNVGSVSTGSGSAISITAGSATNIVFRHLSLNGLGTGDYGINASYFGGALTVEDCTIEGFTGGYGISFAPAASRGLLEVSNTQIRSNTGGILVAPQTGQIASVMLNRVEVVGNYDGIILGGYVVAGTMRDSLVGGNRHFGVSGTASQIYFTVEKSSIIANLVAGIQTQSAGTRLKVGGSTIGGNGTGILASSGSIISFGNNQTSDNGSDGSFSSAKPLN